MSQAFWESVGSALDEIEKAPDVDQVIDVLIRYFAEDWSHGCAGDAFFPGSGGDRQLNEALRHAGWEIVWAKAPYYYVARDPSGQLLTYIEGDVYRGDRR